MAPELLQLPLEALLAILECLEPKYQMPERYKCSTALANLRLTSRVLCAIVSPIYFKYIVLKPRLSDSIDQMLALISRNLARYTRELHISFMMISDAEIIELLVQGSSPARFLFEDFETRIDTYITNHENIWNNWLKIFAEFVTIASVQDLSLDLSGKYGQHSPDTRHPATVIWRKFYTKLVPVLEAMEETRFIAFCEKPKDITGYFYGLLNTWAGDESLPLPHFPKLKALEVNGECLGSQAMGRIFSPRKLNVFENLKVLHLWSINGYCFSPHCRLLTHLQLHCGKIAYSDMMEIVTHCSLLEEVLITRITIITDREDSFSSGWKPPYQVCLFNGQRRTLGTFFEHAKSLSNLLQLKFDVQSIDLGEYRLLRGQTLELQLLRDIDSLRSLIKVVRERRLQRISRMGNDCSTTDEKAQDFFNTNNLTHFHNVWTYGTTFYDIVNNSQIEQ